MPVSSPAEVPASASMRLRLAALARAAALATRGVVGLDAGRTGMRMTASAGLRVDGVVCAALGDGRYHCPSTSSPRWSRCARWPTPSGRASHASRLAGLADRLGPVDVAVEDVQVRTEAGS